VIAKFVVDSADLAGVQRNADRNADQGFTLVEVLVSLTIITVVMTSVAVFLINSTRISRQESLRDTAAQVAVQGMENVRGVRGSTLLSGRAACDASHPCDALVGDKAADLLGAEPQRWDARGPGPLTLPTAGPQPDGSVVSGPDDPEAVVLGGLTFRRYYYVAKCWQAAAADGMATTPRPCTVALASAAFPASFIRLVVAITWPGEECGGGTCSFATTSLLSASPTDPYLATSLPLPPLTSPGDQTGRTGVAVPPLTVSGTGGQGPLVWSAANLPEGLVIDSSTGAISGTPITVATYQVDVRLTDALGRTTTTRFNWTILPPVLTSPGDQLSRTSTLVSLAVVATGGVAALVWSASGLPPGVTINASTGLISGTTATTARSLTPVTVTIVDKSKPPQTASVTFGWRVVTLPMIVNPGAQTIANGVDATGFTMSASGGTGSYVWRGLNLPDGLSIDPATGRIDGRARSGSRFISTVTATDSAGGVGSVTVVVTVTANPPATDLRITGPNADRSTALTTAVSVSLTAAGGGTSYTWTAADLPPGLTLSGAVISGRPSARGSYTVTLTVKSPSGEIAVMMFVWTVT
jgi:prepilin-type N-terminal cleavage/methylation domain-containing protein